MTTSGIEHVTFRFVAQHLDHCATAGKNENFKINIFDFPLSIYFELINHVNGN
jgi:hypothetical protein